MLFYSILRLIVDTVASILGGLLLLRFWMQAVRMRPPSSIANFVFHLTDWLVRPLRKILPGIGGYDWASLLGAFLIAILGVAAGYWMAGFFSVQFVILLALLHVVTWVIYGFMGLLILEVIFSWVNPYAPMAPFIRGLNDPLLRPLRRIIPLVGNIDLSTLVAFLLLQIALQLVNALFASFL